MSLLMKRIAANRTARTLIVGLSACFAFATAAAALSSPQPALADVAGEPLVLEEYRGKVVLVNFWATWCAPCLREMPELDLLAKQIDSSRAVVIGIAADDPVEVKAFADKLGVGYRIASGDPDAIFRWTAELGNVSLGLPFSVLLDADGAIRWRKSGGTISVEEATEIIEEVLANETN